MSAAGPYVQIALMGVLAAAATAAGPALAGAIVGGAGLGGVVGGLMIAAKDARVASAFDGLKEEIGTGLQDAASGSSPPASTRSRKPAPGSGRCCPTCAASSTCPLRGGGR
ncbi:hypothetical protein V2I01_04810 [Micromonospora sp. BRA006-A]|nr:hypothetical protein [Micromonospora sp. BRA006-A]